MTGQSFAEWLAGWAPKYKPHVLADGRIGVIDSPDIAHGRTWLFGLSDYTVISVSGGVIWLQPGESQPAKWRRAEQSEGGQ
jgi:hypothetical protein